MRRRKLPESATRAPPKPERPVKKRVSELKPAPKLSHKRWRGTHACSHAWQIHTSSTAWTCTHTYIHTYTCTRAVTHTHIHTSKHYLNTCANTYTCTHSHAMSPTVVKMDTAIVVLCGPWPKVLAGRGCFACLLYSYWISHCSMLMAFGLISVWAFVCHRVWWGEFRSIIKKANNCSHLFTHQQIGWYLHCCVKPDLGTYTLVEHYPCLLISWHLQIYH